jgi:hypothetical protein
VCDDDPNRVDGVSLEAQRQYLRDWLALQTQLLQAPHVTTQQLREAIVVGSTLLEHAIVNASLTPAFPKMYDGMAKLERRLGTYPSGEGKQSAQLRALIESALWEARITGPESVATATRLDALKGLASEMGWQVPVDILQAEHADDVLQL